MVKVLVAFPLDERYIAQIRAIEGVQAVKATEHDEILKEIEDAEVLFSNKITSEIFNKAKKLMWIQSPFVGVDSLLIDEVRNSNVIVTCARGIHASQASDHVFALILAFARKLPELLEDQKRKVWKVRHPIPFEPLDELKGKTLGIIGFGSIGREIARKGKCFSMRVIGAKRSPSKVEHVDEVYGIDDIDTVLAESDYLVLCVPLTLETENLIGERELRKMKKTAYLINIARGEVVDEKALIKALRERWIAGAALDVVTTEPLPETSELWELDNVIITPHVAGSTPRYWERALSIFMKNLRRFLKGEELINVVDKMKGY
jgi:phosphoglycerate dehydrogenase-like enzyme